MAKKNEEKETHVQYAGFLTEEQRNAPGAVYAYNWDNVTDESHLKKRSAPVEPTADDAQPESETI